MKITPAVLLVIVVAIAGLTVVAYQVVAPMAAQSQQAKLEAFRNR